ncbi:hypothetical protein [Pedobacter frigoris]|uniref:hypothetical protein n=1 Tax=Pedobacter frigoris TaxID=2571272 RepID=UPI00292FF637|nr:hypothetical protein [Pedobacter frigoris]
MEFSGFSIYYVVVYPEFEKLFNLANFANLTKEEMDMYYESQKVRWDNQNALDFAEETGIERGIERGIEKGRAEGQHDKAIEMAVKLKAKNMSIEEIAELTSLSIEEIQTL